MQEKLEITEEIHISPAHKSAIADAAREQPALETENGILRALVLVPVGNESEANRPSFATLLRRFCVPLFKSKGMSRTAADHPLQTVPSSEVHTV